MPMDAEVDIHRDLIKRKKRSINVVLPVYEEKQLKPDSGLLSKAIKTIDYCYRYFYPLEQHPIKKPMEYKRIVVIGIHGWFPSKLLNRVIGEPQGTSEYIASKMQKAIYEHYRIVFGIDLEHIDVICLEKQGKVEDRVEAHLEQLEKYKDLIANADLVVFSAHSQGTPVAVVLLSQMIHQNYCNPQKQKIGIVAMAGICHGPYPTLKSSLVIKYVEADPAKQLFDFNDPYSDISKQFYDSMGHILHSGVRIATIGSWYDQVVPLYSATAQGLYHPNIYRALYIDRQDYQPDFLSHLVVFGLKLKNYGKNDHGLILYLSETLQGSIYGFGTQGHSAIYEEDVTYAVGLQWILGQSNFWMAKEGTVVKHPPLEAITKTNPYYLPWIMARLLSDTEISTHEDLKDDLEAILKLFLVWMPKEGRLKDLKYKLEPLKCKL